MDRETHQFRLDAVKWELRSLETVFAERDGHLLAAIPYSQQLATTARTGLDGKHWGRHLLDVEQTTLGFRKHPPADSGPADLPLARSDWRSQYQIVFGDLDRNLKARGVPPTVRQEFAEIIVRHIAANLNGEGAPYRYFWLLLVPPRQRNAKNPNGTGIELGNDG